VGVASSRRRRIAARATISLSSTFFIVCVSDCVPITGGESPLDCTTTIFIDAR
jgi:hypothetical protein